MTRFRSIHLLRLLGLPALFVMLAATSLTAAAELALDPPPPPDARCVTGGQGTTCFWRLEFVRLGDFGPLCQEQGFSVLFVAFGTATYKMEYDDQGGPLREIRHVSFEGTLTNSATGASIPYEGRFNRFEDFQAETIALSGLRIKIPVPGGGTLVLFSGREFVNLITGDVFQSNPDEVAQVCTLLG